MHRLEYRLARTWDNCSGECLPRFAQRDAWPFPRCRLVRRQGLHGQWQRRSRGMNGGAGDAQVGGRGQEFSWLIFGQQFGGMERVLS